MAIDVWGMLQKSQVDPELIEEAIERWVKEHNDDETAHIGEGRSLDQHKLEPIIDHLVASIIADKIKDFEIFPEKLSWSKLFINCVFESLDGWSKYGTGEAAIQLGSLELNTTLGLNKYVRLIARGDMIGINLGGKNPIFETILKFGDHTYQNAYFGIGADGGYFLGFKVIDGTLYACWAEDDEEYTEQIFGVDIEKFHTYRAIAKNSDQIYFYIDEVLKFSTPNIFSDVVRDIAVFTLYLKVTAETSRWIVLTNCRFTQDR